MSDVRGELDSALQHDSGDPTSCAIAALTQAAANKSASTTPQGSDPAWAALDPSLDELLRELKRLKELKREQLAAEAAESKQQADEEGGVMLGAQEGPEQPPGNAAGNSEAQPKLLHANGEAAAGRGPGSEQMAAECSTDGVGMGEERLIGGGEPSAAMVPPAAGAEQAPNGGGDVSYEQWREMQVKAFISNVSLYNNNKAIYSN